MTMQPKAITLLSGGLDSSVATLIGAETAKIELALTFDYGQRAVTREVKAAKKFCEYYNIPHEVISLSWLATLSTGALTDENQILPQFTDTDLDKNPKKEKDSAKAVWVPNRNAIFINIASAYAEAKNCSQIIAGFNAEEAKTFPDNSVDFIDTQNKLLLYSTLSHPKIICPTQNMKKAEIAKEATRLGMNPEFFWSCYEGGASMCGTCESCSRVARAFKKAKAWELISHRFEKQNLPQRAQS